MWIKELIIDGFKSYANRTVIPGWHPQFNAITGLNGSGKSNILDAICFVLGISNLSQVRCSNLQELVYKQGQSRVTKASVTIVFNNEETRISPVGYEQFKEITVTRQIVIGGRNKYLINGSTAQLSKVKNLFHSVQLNVNNPHFLIMQGRITKVINMKPPEILGMIEEAAGTRMYETKKIGALKTIQRKEIKVKEINKILLEDITPTLEKLRKERSSYMEWSANNTEIERLTRFLTAYQFYSAQHILQNSVGNLEAMEAKKEEIKTNCETMKEEMENKTDLIKQLMLQKENQIQSTFKSLENAVSSRSKELVKDTSTWQHATDNLHVEIKNQQAIEKNLQDISNSINTNNNNKEKLENEIKTMETAYNEVQSQFDSLQGELLGVNMSEKNKDKEQGTLTSQLMAAQKEIATIESEKKQIVIKAKHLKLTVTKKERELRTGEKEHRRMEVEYEKKKKILTEIERKLKEMNYDEHEKENCEENLVKTEDELTSLKDNTARMNARCRVDFEYRDPHRNFDRSKVKGLFAKLIQVKDPNVATALEVTAGGRLYNVVVDTQQTGKDLLERGQLRRRVTIIPLNKISRRALRPAVIQQAEQLVGKDNVCTALSLVGYEKEVEAAVQYVFGGSFICRDSTSAEQVTFHPRIRTKSVTHQGDVFDPAGTLTGGSRPSGGSLLIQLQKLNEMEQRLRKVESSVKILRVQFQKLSQGERSAQSLLQKKELYSHELSLMNNRLQKSSFSQMSAELEQLQKQLNEAQTKMETLSSRHQESLVRCKELEIAIKDFESQRAARTERIEKQAAACKKKIALSSKALKAKKQDLNKLNLEITQLQKDLSSLKEEKKKITEKIVALNTDVEVAVQALKAKRKSYDEASEKLEEAKQQLVECDKKISNLTKARNAIGKKKTDIELDLKKIGHKITRLVSEQKTSKDRVELMMKKYDWIATEKQFFGRPQTDYDFQKTSPKQVDSRLASIKEEQEILSKKINKKVMGMFEKAEQEYQDLIKKRDIIEKDKRKIEETITELDRKKNQVLETTFHKVTGDFGSIFSTLLPGTMAKLQPPEDGTILDGLEVKVGFGDAWKNSLTELSGGQRSLLALSLILALLRFKPAPMYILDEIDAALDPSHTQNIGTMLRTHFSQSQFIVVSLKEGMFSNANIIFRTKFVDGVSTVSRTINRRNKIKRSSPHQ